MTTHKPFSRTENCLTVISEVASRGVRVLPTIVRRCNLRRTALIDSRSRASSPLSLNKYDNIEFKTYSWGTPKSEKTLNGSLYICIRNFCHIHSYLYSFRSKLAFSADCISSFTERYRQAKQIEQAVLKELGALVL